MAQQQRILEILLTLRDQASAQLTALQKNLKGMEPTFRDMRNYGTAAFAAISGEAALAVKAAADSAKIHAQLNEVLKSTGGVAGVTAQAADDLAQSLKRVTVYDDDAILGGENLLLTFTSIGKDIFPDATRAMLDMSEALGQDVSSSAIQLGKALQDPILGVTALRRVGVNFNDTQIELIKNMVESGRVMDAQRYILAELNKEFGGSANINDFGDRIAKAKQGMDDMQKAIGFALVPAIEKLTEKLKPVIDDITQWIQDHPQLAANILLATGLIAGLTAMVGTLGLLLPSIIAGFTLLAGPVGIIGGIFAGLILIIYNLNEAIKIWQQDSEFVILGLKVMWQDFKNYLLGIWEAIKAYFREVWDGIKATAAEAIDWITSKLQPLINLVNSVKNALGSVSVGSFKFGAPTAPGFPALVPKFADGGVVTRPTLGIVGEAGPEAIIPLSQARGLGGVTVNVYGDVSGTELVERVKESLMASMRFDARFAL